ncbi:GtrA family protein [Patescibacteria group bacterium]|nr:GtrA family protein [Patescibacteria group bacterium]MBU1721613.1 GtrA family protein [Patescibacteria group bacterium]MBU1901725.1 GtrA family protein [Patescibacteria group bacterium]
MFATLIQHLRTRQVQIQLVRYFVIGLSGLAIDIGLLALCTRLFGINPTIAVIFVQFVVIIYNFLLNKYWTFKSQGLAHKQFVRYSVLVTWNYLFGVTVMYFCNEIAGMDEIIVRLVSIAITVLWNFILYKKWIYR